MVEIDVLGADLALRALPPGPELRDARQALGISRRAVAQQLGCTEAAVGNWERGTHKPNRYHVTHYIDLLRTVAIDDEAAAGGAT